MAKKVYQPDIKDVLACFVLLLKKHGHGQMVVKRSVLEQIKTHFSNKVELKYYQAEDVVKVTLTQSFESGIIIPSGGVRLN